MLTGIRHKAGLAVGCTLIAMGLTACGDGIPEPTPKPTPDIEATVEARIEEKQAEDAALEAKAEATAQIVPAATSVSKISTDSSQSFGNSHSVDVVKSDLDRDGGPEQPESQPSHPLPEKPKHLLLDSRLNKLVGQIGSRSTADIASSAPVSNGDLVAVTVRLSHNSSSTVDFLESVGAIVANIGTDYIEAYTPVIVLVPLSERDGVLRVEAIVPSEQAVTDR